MSGVKYLLDTNFVLGMLKSTPEVLALVSNTGLMAHQCAFSAVTRMELLGYPGITSNEYPLIKLPDALIAATALCHGLELLTIDTGLQADVRSAT